jgi:hypothetical protein
MRSLDRADGTGSVPATGSCGLDSVRLRSRRFVPAIRGCETLWQVVTLTRSDARTITRFGKAVVWLRRARSLGQIDVRADLGSNLEKNRRCR